MIWVSVISSNITAVFLGFLLCSGSVKQGEKSEERLYAY